MTNSIGGKIVALKDTLGINIKEKMKEKGVSQTELANYVGVHQTTVSTWIQGKKVPHFETLEKIADHLDTSVIELLDNGSGMATGIENNLKARPEIEPLLYEASKVPTEEIDFAMETLKRINSAKIKG